jgi:hypothetical protein
VHAEAAQLGLTVGRGGQEALDRGEPGAVLVSRSALVAAPPLIDA